MAQAAGGATPFAVEYKPTDIGGDSCTVSIDNDDADEDPYTFDIKGTTKKTSNLQGVYLLLFSQ